MKLKLRINSNLEDNDGFVVKKSGETFVIEVGKNVEVIFEEPKADSVPSKKTLPSTSSKSSSTSTRTMNSFNKSTRHNNKSLINGDIVDDNRDSRLIRLSNILMEKVSQMSYSIFFEDAVKKSYIKNNIWILNFNEEELQIIKKKYINLLEDITKGENLKVSINSNNKINM